MIAMEDGASLRRKVWLAVAALLAPATARADNMAVLGVVVAGMFVALPGLALTIGLIIASIVLGAKNDIRPSRRRYAWTAIILSALPVVVFPISSIFLSKGAQVGNVTAILTAALALPCLVSILLARRVLQRNPQ